MLVVWTNIDEVGLLAMGVTETERCILKKWLEMSCEVQMKGNWALFRPTQRGNEPLLVEILGCTPH